MRWLERFRMAMLMLFRRKAEATRLSNELEFHLEQQIKENITHGMNAEEARYAALRTFGNPALLRDQARSSWSWNWLEKFLRDLRYGVRTLTRSPGFALTAILVMALGIGAATSLFTIVRAVLLKPLPFRDPDNLVMVYEHFRADNGSGGGDGFNPVSPADFNDWRQQTHGFADMAAWHGYDYDLTGEHEELPELIQAAAGSWNLFSLLGTPMALGRSFLPEEDQVDANHVVVLTWSLFQRRFAGDPAVLGKQIRLNGMPYQLIGVLPRWFTYPDARVQLWVPYASTFNAKNIARHEMHQSYVVARTRPGVTAAAAAKEVGALQYQLHLAHASLPVAEEVRIRSILDDVVRDVKTPLTVLLCAVGCMLLIACLNVSNLLVARSATRRKELAVRGALGGGRLTLIAEQMAESFLICISGGTLGILLSLGATRWLATHWRALPRAEAIHVDGMVLGFAIGLVFLTALLSGLLPAISSTGTGILSGLQESSRSIGGSVSRAALRKTLLTAEIALTVILLLAAGLLFKSFLHLRTSNLGCAADHVLTMKYALPQKQYDTREKVIAFHEGVLERVRRLPGVLAAGLVSTPPGGGYDGDNVFTLPEHPSTSFQLQDDAMYRTADPGYFTAMQIPLIRGRFFTDQERLDRSRYMIISKRFADDFFPGEDPIGKHVTVTIKEETYEILGVVGDTLWNVAKPVKAMMYFPILAGRPGDGGMATIVVRTAADPLSMAIPVQKQVAALDPALPVYDILDMQQIVGKSTATQSFSATLVLAFAILSLLLAAIGLYGVLSYLVTQRITEIGIRVAMGAQRAQILRLVLLDGLGPVFVGLVIGLVGGAIAARLIRTILYGTSPLDPVVFASMVGGLLLTAIGACALPALHASRIEPMQALRIE
jgi:predicted permease